MKLYGCHNRAEYLEGYSLHGISRETGQPVWAFVPFRMARDCQYTHTELGTVDPKCDGCKHRVNSVTGQKV